MTKKTHLILFSLLMLLLFSCIKKEEFDFSKMTKPQYNGEWALPLIDSKITIKDILKDSANIFVEDSITHSMMVVYESTKRSQAAHEKISIPNQTSSVNEAINIPNPFPVGQTYTTSFSKKIVFTASNNSRIDSILFKNSTFVCSMSSFLNHDASITVTIPNAKKNGAAFNFTFSFPTPGQQSASLAGYMLKFTNTPISRNEITINYSITVTSNGGGNLSPYTLYFNNYFNNTTYNRLYGYFGQLTFPISDTLSPNIFGSTTGGRMQIKDVNASINMKNSYGMPIDNTVNDFRSHSKINPPYNVNIIPHPGFVNPIKMPVPTPPFIGHSVDTTIVLNKTNSYIIDAINISPDFIYINTTAVSNPHNDSSITNFVTDSSRFYSKLRVELPLYGSIIGFRILDTIDFPIKDMNQIESMLITVNADNGFPFDAIVQIYLADSLHHVLDSLLLPNEQVILAAPVGEPPDLKVIAPQSRLTDITLETEKLEKLIGIKKMFLKVILDSKGYPTAPDNKTIRIYSDYMVNIRMCAKVKLKVKL